MNIELIEFYGFKTFENGTSQVDTINARHPLFILSSIVSHH